MNQLYTVLISMLPVIELKGAIPIAIDKFYLPWWQAYIFGVIGSMISVILILLFLKPVSDWLTKNFKIFAKFFHWLFEYTRTRHGKKIEIYKESALVLIAAFPIPVLGGAWTAALIAFLFGIKFWRSFLLIFLGTLMAGIIYTLGTLGVINL